MAMLNNQMVTKLDEPMSRLKYHPCRHRRRAGQADARRETSGGDVYGRTWMWVWVNTYRYIFSGMNIHLPAILMFTRGTRFWHTAISNKQFAQNMVIYKWNSQSMAIHRFCRPYAQKIFSKLYCCIYSFTITQKGLTRTKVFPHWRIHKDLTKHDFHDVYFFCVFQSYS